ncbi:hypothetical protein SAICODRAFT_4784 [Saitoella complicata NRRL Y-17804]|uniref:RED-like N-terminal domain-containing protein n=1 Tax=Saitoella complicata (strain BCRC 22490 / CBS 7301 / JCM 7358 / NBRC 10748 / NRRL Y-17804) TaxID=698492 RepID=A0A0E9N9P5_SAICN|nr:uncharacterized protein SAICODRAFT_4784 [Saitoella complicata NRRL Y-17804]ODQ56608.1 hypothetical protein SAICODRAFT_4784 [Saitoella complicata NRRL Y-17804]GAO46421.1 hypothetical protein G7K_0652-t1 [Saitoella complicata NRRL Y-17804]
MNQQDFRKLLATPRPGSGGSANSRSGFALPGRGKPAGALGMTPRNVKPTNVFAKPKSPGKEKKEKSILPEGYVDRAKLRQQQADKEEEKLKDVDARTAYEQSKLLGGDLEHTHLVKGLDFALLKKVKQGEDLSGEKPREEGPKGGVEEDLEAAFQTAKAEPPKKMTRDELLAKMRAGRTVAKSSKPVEEGLDKSKFRKIGVPPPPAEEPKEEEEKVKIVVGPDGKIKRLVKKKKKTQQEKKPEPEPVANPMNDDGDIFADVGEYDPFAGMDSSDDEKTDKEETKEPSETPAEPPRRNYFTSTTADSDSDGDITTESLRNDPTLKAALKKASQIAEKKGTELEDEEEVKARKRMEMLARDDADFEFGSDEDEGPKKKKRRRKAKGDDDDDD